VANKILRNLSGSRLFVNIGGLLVTDPEFTVALPAISVPTTTQQTEGLTHSITVSLNFVHNHDVTFSYTTVNGAAIAGTDYTAVSGTGTITAGQLSTSINVLTADRSGVQGNRGFSFTISNPLANGETLPIARSTCSCTILENDVAEPTGSPINDNVHPRFWINAGPSYAMAGTVSIEDLRTRINTYYSSQFQTVIDGVNSFMNTATDAIAYNYQDSGGRSIEGNGAAVIWNMALLAFLNPETMNTLRTGAGQPTYNFGGYAQVDYLNKAYTCFMRAMTLDYRHAGRTPSYNSDTSPEEHPRTLYYAMTYDWIRTIDPTKFTDADKAYIVESMVMWLMRPQKDANGDPVAGTTTRPLVWSRTASYAIGAWQHGYQTENAQTALARTGMLAYALKGEVISGNSVCNGLTHQANLDTVYAEGQKTVQRILDGFKYYCGDEPFWPEGLGLYGQQALPAVTMLLSIAASSTGQNYFEQTGFLRRMGYYTFAHMEPIEWGYPEYAGRGMCRKIHDMSEESWSSQVRVGVVAAKFASAVEPGQERIHNWYRTRTDNIHTQYAGSDWWKTARTQFFFGALHGTSTAPQLEAEYPNHMEFGNGEFNFRTTTAYDTTAATAWYSIMPMRYLTGGHQEGYSGNVQLWRSGPMLMHGVNDKGASSGATGLVADCGSHEAQSCQFHISGPGNGTDPAHARWAIDSVDFNTSIHPLCPSGGGCQDALTVVNGVWNKSWYSDLNKNGYGYVWSDLKHLWVNKAPTQAIREILWLDPVNNGQPYMIIQDKAVVNSPSATRVGFQKWRVFADPEILDGATESLIGGSGTKQAAAHPTNTDVRGGGEYQSATKSWRVDNDRGDFYTTQPGGGGMLYATVLYPPTPDTRFIGGDNFWCMRDLSDSRGLDIKGLDSTPRNTYPAAMAASGFNELANTESYINARNARWMGAWSVENRHSDTAATNQRFLTVFHPGLKNTHTSKIPVVALNSASGAAMTGGVIQDPARWRVFLLPTAHGTTRTTTAFTYTVNGLGASSAHHVLVGLSTSATWNISRSGATNVTFTITPGSGSSNITTTANGTVEFTL
jgi:hypothetical protein